MPNDPALFATIPADDLRTGKKSSAKFHVAEKRTISRGRFYEPLRHRHNSTVRADGDTGRESPLDSLRSVRPFLLLGGGRRTVESDGAVLDRIEQQQHALQEVADTEHTLELIEIKHD